MEWEDVSHQRMVNFIKSPPVLFKLDRGSSRKTSYLLTIALIWETKCQSDDLFLKDHEMNDKAVGVNVLYLECYLTASVYSIGYFHGFSRNLAENRVIRFLAECLQQRYRTKRAVSHGRFKKPRCREIYTPRKNLWTIGDRITNAIRTTWLLSNASVLLQ